MRVITGIAKGKRLINPKDNRIRPTTDRIKESLFNIINPFVNDSIFIDCFSGTGAIGVEAISRGAKEVYFIDNHNESIGIVRKNLQITDFRDKSKILQMDIISAISELSSKSVKADIIFMDPPYNLDIITSILTEISINNILKDEGKIIVEHDKDYSPQEIINDFIIYDIRKYGNTSVSFYKKR
ncbi:MAG: 16S rRNA (guanine(966)-N(2))-methyltransferase RsmD [Eubacteriaceae bacterium]